MNVGPEDFRRHFEMLSDETLLATQRGDLVDIAKECYDVELARRGLNSAGLSDSVEQPGAPVTAGDDLVEIATFISMDEANFARGLLQSASIPCHLGNEHAGLGSFELKLSVPASFLEPAMDVLGAEISDDELAAQAEAAAPRETEEESLEESPPA